MYSCILGLNKDHREMFEAKSNPVENCRSTVVHKSHIACTRNNYLLFECLEILRLLFIHDKTIKAESVPFQNLSCALQNSDCSLRKTKARQ